MTYYAILGQSSVIATSDSFIGCYEAAMATGVWAMMVGTVSPFHVTTIQPTTLVFANSKEEK